MQSLASGGEYAITDEMKEKLGDFYGGYLSEGETRKRSAPPITETIM